MRIRCKKTTVIPDERENEQAEQFKYTADKLCLTAVLI